MNLTLITITFLTVNLDFFVILLFLCQHFALRDVLIGYLMGLLILMTGAFLIGQTLQHFLPEWLLGLLGLIPIWTALHDRDEEFQISTQRRPILTTLLTYLSVCAGCNLSLFLPVLANQSWITFALTIVYIGLLTILIVFLINWIRQFQPVQSLIRRWGEPLMKICYIGIGIYVLFDSGLVHHLITFI